MALMRHCWNRNDCLVLSLPLTAVFLDAAKFVMDVGCGNGAFRGGDDNLVESANHIARRVESGDRCLLMGIDPQGTVLITAGKKRARQIVLRATAESQINHV